MMSVLEHIRTSLQRILGFQPFKKVDPGESYSDGRFYAIRAIGGDVTFTATTSKGDNLNSNTTVQQDANLVGTFESITVDGSSSGSALIYIFQ